MPSQHRRTRGFATERLVADYLRQWWPYATVGRGADPSGDILNISGLDIEVKAVAKFQPLAWLRQSRARTAKSGNLGVVVLRCNGQGQNVSEYAALLPLSALVELLRKAKYNDLPPDIDWDKASVRCDSCGNWKIKWWECKACGKEAPNADV